MRVLFLRLFLLFLLAQPRARVIDDLAIASGHNAARRVRGGSEFVWLFEDAVFGGVGGASSLGAGRFAGELAEGPWGGSSTGEKELGYWNGRHGCSEPSAVREGLEGWSGRVGVSREL